MEQQNPYIKQFPELFRDKKIIYVHGYGSSGQSGTVTRIRTVLPGATVRGNCVVLLNFVK